MEHVVLLDLEQHSLSPVTMLATVRLVSSSRMKLTHALWTMHLGAPVYCQRQSCPLHRPYRTKAMTYRAG